MIILGLAGPARAGKNTVAEYLSARYGFVPFAFSDALYREVQLAFGLPDQSLLRDPETKDVPSERLILVNCRNDEFIGTAIKHIPHESGKLHTLPLSPRQILQWWGTEYRRAQNSDYWVGRASDWLHGLYSAYRYPEQAPQYFVEVGTRFENEREFIAHRTNRRGNIWHIHRDHGAVQSEHASARPLPVLPGERELFNNDTIERLHRGVDLLMSTNAQFVRVEPMLPAGQYYSRQSDGRDMLCNADGTRSIFDDVDE